MYLAAIFYLLINIIHANAEREENLTGKNVVVTGGARGIGKAITEHCLKDGARVIFVDYNLTQGIQTEREFKSKYGAENIQFIYGDITIDLDRIYGIIFKLVKYVHILVNNAAILDEYDPVKMANTNFIGTMLWTDKFYDFMRKDYGGKGGKIMNIASSSGYYRDPFTSNYKATKFGIIGMCVGKGHEFNYLRTGVKVFALCPGYTYTDMTLQQMVVDEQVEIFDKYRKVVVGQTAEAVGQAAVVLLKTGTSGMSYTIDGGELYVSPDSYNITVQALLSL